MGDEMAELERFDLRVETAAKLQNMGYTLELRDDKFEVSGKAHLIDKPQPIFTQRKRYIRINQCVYLFAKNRFFYRQTITFGCIIVKPS